MGLLTGILIASAIKGVVSISENVAEAAAAKSNERAAEATARAAESAAYNNSVQYRTQYVPQANSQSAINSYTIDLFYAKVALISYISNADERISREERREIYKLLDIAQNMYGKTVATKAEEIIDNEIASFMSLEPYLQKVQERDLDSLIFFADEVAQTDNKLTPEEEKAIKKIRSYIDSRKEKTEFHSLICPSCGGIMNADSYGYKAVCRSCGRETIMNTENSPARVNLPAACASCGRTLAKFDNSKRFTFCPYCGGNVYSKTGTANAAPMYASSQPVVRANTRNVRTNNTGPNLYISFNTINPSVGLVTRIVSTGVKNAYINGQTISFHLPQGNQEIILKIGMKNYSRNVFIPPSNSPVRIYASFNGRAQISIDQPPY